MTKRYYVANKFRFTLFVVITLLLLTVIANCVLGFSTADSLTKVEYMEYQVSSGDTLWSIAQSCMTDCDDVREAVYTLCQINDITASDLQSGMVIQVPMAQPC